MSREQVIEEVAKGLAAAFWKGRLHAFEGEWMVFEKMVQAAATEDAKCWVASAEELVNKVAPKRTAPEPRGAA
jgi:hypothetical protein